MVHDVLFLQLERLDSDEIPSNLEALLSINQELQSVDKELQQVIMYMLFYCFPFLMYVRAHTCVCVKWNLY